MKKLKLKPYEEKIVRILLEAGISLTTNEIAENGHMNWRTAQHHLIILNKKRIVKKDKGDGYEYWTVNEKELMKYKQL